MINGRLAPKTGRAKIALAIQLSVNSHTETYVPTVRPQKREGITDIISRVDETYYPRHVI